MASLTKVKINNIDTSVTYVYDPLILLNTGSTLANTDVGFVFNRDGGISSNVALYWNETTDKVTIAYTPATGLPNSNIAISKYANVAADWYFGNLAGGTTNTVWISANVLPTANAFYNFGSPTQRWNVGYFAATTLDLGGSQISVDPTNGFKFIVGGSGTPTYLASNGLISGTSISTSGTISAVGAINTSGNVLASQVSAGSIVTTGVINAGGNVLAQTAIFNYLDVNGNIVVGDVGIPGAGHSIIGNIVQSGAGTVWFNTPGNLLAAYGQFGQIRSDGLINTSANVMAATGRFGTVLSDGFINTSANVSAALYTGGSVVVSGVINTASNVLTSQITVFGNATIGAITTPGVVHNLVGNISQSGAGTIFFNTPGNVMAATGQFGAVNVSGYVNAAGNISTPQLNAGQINTTGNVSASQLIASTLSTRSAYGNIHLTQFASIFAEGNSAENQSIVQVSTTGLSDGAGMWAFTGLDSRVYSSRGIAFATGLTMRGQDTPTGGVIKVAITAAGDLWANAVTTSTSTSTGALVVAGGVGIGGNVIAGGYINTAGNLLATAGTFNSLTVNGHINASGNIIATTAKVGSIESSGVIYANSTSASTSSTTGALQVAGGIGAAKDSYFGGNLTLAGNLFVQGNVTYFNSNNVTFSDALIYLADGATGDVVDIGFVGHFVNPGYQHTGFARDATDGVWKLFANVVPEPTTTIDFTNATYSNLMVGNILAGQATITGLNSAGFINTSGNVSAAVHLGGQVAVSGLINTAGNILSTGAVHNSLTVNGNTTVANITTTGAGQFSGPFNESTTVSGVYAGNLNLSPRVGFFNGTASQNWQIDNNFGTFRWYTPGVTRMSLDPNGNLTVNGTANVTYTGSGESALQITGYASRGGTGYHDFLRVTNGYASATNPNKFFRVDSAGTLQIINSAYTANPLSLTDDGRFSVSGNITAGSLTIPGAQHVLNGNVQINAIGSIQVPVGTTLQRPGSSIAGQIRFNTDTNAFEGYGNAWAAIGGGGGGSAPGGVTTTMQYNNGGALGGIATMNYILANSAIIISTGTTSTSTGTGALQIVGGLGITENINVGGYVKVTGAVNTSGNVLASQVSAGSVVTTGAGNFGGNVLASGGIFNLMAVNGNLTVGTLTTPQASHSIIGNVTQSGAGTIFYNTPGNILDANIAAGTVTSDIVNSTNNGNGTNFKVGDDAWIGDINIANTFGIKGQQDGTQGYVRFGNVNTNALGVNGAGPLSWGGVLNIVGNLLAATTTLGATTVNGTALTVSGFINSTGNILSTGAIHNSLTVNGTTTTQGVVPVTSNTYTLGSTTAWYSIVYAKAMQAQYADLAETYASDKKYVPGTVLVFGGSEEVTISSISHDPAIAGVVSTNPAYHMNAQAEGVPVALQGRVPTRVKGPVTKGDRLVSSDLPGVACKMDRALYEPGCIIGKALEDILDDRVHTIEVVVGRV